MTSPTPEEAARPEEVAREILRLESLMPSDAVGPKLLEASALRHAMAAWAPDLARAYLDLLEKNEKLRADHYCERFEQSGLLQMECVVCGKPFVEHVRDARRTGLGGIIRESEELGLYELEDEESPGPSPIGEERQDEI